MCLKYFQIILIFVLFFPFQSIFSEERVPEKAVFIGRFQPYKGQAELTLSNLESFLSEKLQFEGYITTVLSEPNLSINLEKSLKNNVRFYVTGFYKRSEYGNLNLYAQIYNPRTGYVIDAYNLTDEISGFSSEFKLDPKEFKKSDESVQQELADKLAKKIRSNSKLSERRENIEEFLLNHPILKAHPEIRISKEDLNKAIEDVIKFTSRKDDLVISVSKFSQKSSEAPADVTVIPREVIRKSGYRNLSEALNSVPQVYSHWVGQNWGTDFRGLFVNNQIERRVLYLQDGKKLNDYFHFGEFYADVFTDMERIEKIEVIKGPGAAIYGNNSITGVVNVITRKPQKKNEMEFITEYDSVLKTTTGRALYYSKFSEKFSVSLDVSKFEGRGYYESGYNSWGSTRFYDPRNGTTTGTSQYGRDTAPLITEQRAWTSTGTGASNGFFFPNYNLDMKYGDWNLKSYYMSKKTSWIPPQFDSGGFGGDTLYGSPRNDRIWGTGAVILDYTPTFLEKYEANFRIFRQLNINSDYREKDFQGFSGSTLGPAASSFGLSNTGTSASRLSSPSYYNYVQAFGGGFVKRYASTAYAEGGEFQLTPVKIENSSNSFLRSFRFMLGGNSQAVRYINYQEIVGLNGVPEKKNQGIGDDGRQLGLWTQFTGNFNTNTILVFGLRYDTQKIYNVYRHQKGIENDIAFESFTDPISRLPSAGQPPYYGPGIGFPLSPTTTDSWGDVIARGYVQPFQRKNVVSEDLTPRLAFIQNLPSSDTTIKLMYAEAFRMVTPQELIRLPRDLGNARSEKVKNTELNLIQGFMKGSLIFSGTFFTMQGSTIYAFNASVNSFGQTPDWENTGGSATMNYFPDKFWRLSGSFTSYRLRRPSDVSFLNILFTPPPQALNSPTKLWKASLSRSILNDQYSITLDFFYNNEIHLMQNPPQDFISTRNNSGGYYDLQPLNQERATASSLFGTGIGPGITRYRVWKVPPSQFFNLSFSSNLGNDLILVVSAKNIFNQKVFFPLDTESGSFSSPAISPNQLLSFGREIYLKLGYRF